jgi:hypothetical protein
MTRVVEMTRYGPGNALTIFHKEPPFARVLGEKRLVNISWELGEKQAVPLLYTVRR